MTHQSCKDIRAKVENDLDLEKAHEQSIEIYRKFWKLIEPSPVTPSQQFTTGAIDSGKLLKLEKIKRFDAKPQQKY